MSLLFSRADIRWLSDAVRGVYGAQTESELARVTIDLTHAKFGSMITAAEAIAQNLSRYERLEAQIDVAYPKDYVAFLHDHPGFSLLREGHRPLTLHVGNAVSRAAYERTDFHNGFGRKIGLRDSFILQSFVGPTFFTLSILRDARFSPKERQLLRAFRLHLAAAWMRVGHPSAHARALALSLTPSLACAALSAELRRILAAYFPGWSDGPRLPEALDRWLRASAHQAASGGDPPLRSFAVDSARGRLVVRYFPHPSQACLHCTEMPWRPDYFRLRERGLTARECEVVHWLARGKRNGEIATILGCAARTADKHVEHLRAKFAVASRAAVVDAARRWVETPA